MSNKPVTKQGDPGTTGHEWDGIREFNNPLPRWWVWVFYLTIIWAIGYTIAYPAWPTPGGHTAGVLGWSTRANVAAEIAAFEEANAAINARLAAADLAAIDSDADLRDYARNAGEAVFETWCIQCHQTGARGARGYPGLLDDDWLWGGDIAAIHATITHGIRSADDADTRFSEMPAFGQDELLTAEQIGQVANFVMSLSGTAQDAAQVAAGATVFADNCASCHMEDGTGDRSQGAPNLADAIWLFDGDHATIVETVTNARRGVMPAWAARLNAAEIRAVATYVHGLGGGE